MYKYQFILVSIMGLLKKLFSMYDLWLIGVLLF